MSFSTLTPTAETRAYEFTQLDPLFDGNEVTVAILDTGVDPSAPGLQVTPRGARKLIDVIDATGSGDVNMKKTTRADANGLVKGASGRLLTIDSSWDCPSGDFRVGVKHACELMPRELARRVVRDRGEADRAAAEAPRAAAAAAATTIEAAGEAASLAAVLASLATNAGINDDPGALLDIVTFQDSKNQWRLAVDTVGDGIFTGVVALGVFSSTGEWGVLDPATLQAFAFGGARAGGDVISIVTDAGAHGTHVAGIVAAHHPKPQHLTGADGVAPGARLISVRIGDARLGSMETGAALLRGVRAACDAGAHIINMSYGEPSSRPGFGRVIEAAKWAALERGVIFVASAGNAGPALSTVGAPGGASNHVIGVGAIATQGMMDDLYSMRSHYAPAATRALVEATAGELVLASSLDRCIVSQDTPLVDALGLGLGLDAPPPPRAFHDRSDDNSYTWSSRGPAADGALGVSVCAPGGAITSVPRWCLSANQLMNGTSMSSPNVAGCVALLVSALRARGLRICPYGMRRALEASAQPLTPHAPDVLSQGHGLVDVVGAWSVLINEAVRDVERGGPLPFIDVSVAGGGAGAGDASDRGIYWRDAAQSCAAADVPISLVPLWRSSDTPSVRASFSATLALDVVYAGCKVGTPPPDWVSAPTHMAIANGARSFSIHVDARSLPLGSVTCAEVRAYEVFASDASAAASAAGARAAGRAPLVRVPITIIRPETPLRDAAGVVRYSFGAAPGVPSAPGLPPTRLPFRAGTVHRRFLTVPHGATWAEVLVSRADDAMGDASTRILVVHATQVIRGSSGRGIQEDIHLRLAPGESDGAAVELRAGGATLEVCVAQLWSSLGDCCVTVAVRFHGVSASPSLISIGSADASAPVIVTPLVGDVALRPVGRLDEWTTHFEAQAGATPKALRAERAAPPAGGALQHSITFEYKVKLEKDETKLSLRIPLLGPLIYDSSFDGLIFGVYATPSQRLVAAGDVFGASDIALPKGDYTVRADLLGVESALAALVKSTAGPLLTLTRRIPDKEAPTLSLTASHPYASAAPPPPARLRAHQPATLWVSAPPGAAPKGAKAGDVLTGFLLLDDAQPRHLLRADRSYALGDASTLVGRHPRGLRVALHLQADAFVAKGGPKKEPVLAVLLSTIGGGPGAGGESPSSSSSTLAVSGATATNDTAAADSLLADALRDALIARLRGLPPLAPAPPSVDAAVVASITPVAAAAAAAAPPLLSLTLPRESPGINAFEALATALLSAAPTGAPRLSVLSARASTIDAAIFGKIWGAIGPPPHPLSQSRRRHQFPSFSAHWARSSPRRMRMASRGGQDYDMMNRPPGQSALLPRQRLRSGPKRARN